MWHHGFNRHFADRFSTLFTLWFEQKQHGAADTEQRMLFTCSGYSLKWHQGDTEETNCWIKSSFLFSLRAKYFCSFVKWRLNPCQMYYFTDLLAMFLDVDRVNYIAVYRRSESSRNSSKYLHLCYEDERRPYGFGTTWGWVINDRIFILAELSLWVITFFFLSFHSNI